MKKKRTNEKKNWTIYLPILSMIFVAILFMYSNSYTEKWNFDWKGIRGEIKDSIVLLDKYGQITSGSVGESGRTPQQWHRQIWLLRNTTDAELLRLTDYPSGTVKAIAYQGLIYKSNIDRYSLLKKCLNDSLTVVSYQSGCLGNQLMLSDYLLSYYTNLNDAFPSMENLPDMNLTAKQKSEIVALFKQRKSKEDYYINEYYKSLR